MATAPRESSSSPGQAAALTRKVRRVNKLPFPQSLQRFSKRINGQAVLWKAKSMEEHCAPVLISLVITRGEKQVARGRGQRSLLGSISLWGVSWDQYPCGEGLMRMLALPGYLPPFIIYPKSSRINDLLCTQQMLLIWPLLKH